MAKLLFVPLNRNHVMIFEQILKSLSGDYLFLCHDRISESDLYHTADLLSEKNIPYRHLPVRITRSSKDSLLKKIYNFFKIKSQIIQLLNNLSPEVCILALDNDPIARIIIDESIKRGKKTILVQEALIRPHEYKSRKKYLSDHLSAFLSKIGVYIAYLIYGAGGCDKLLVGGKIAADIFETRYVPKERIVLVGHPKYDRMIGEIMQKTSPHIGQEVFLYAASTKVIQNSGSISFLKQLVDTTSKLGLHLIIKLHPRGMTRPSDIRNVLGLTDSSLVEIIKDGIDTFELLKRSSALITISSTMALEALMLNKECVLASYLAGESILEYGAYNAVHIIDSEEEIYNVINNATTRKKAYDDKIRLLEAELFKLDGRSGYRAAKAIERCIG